LPALFHDLNSSGATGASAFSFLISTSSLITAAGNYKLNTLGGFQWHEIHTNFPKNQLATWLVKIRGPQLHTKSMVISLDYVLYPLKKRVSC